MNENDGLDRIFAGKATFLAWIGIPLAYFVALVRFPEYWAIGTGIVFVIASGLFTSKIILGLENSRAAFGLAPVFGTGWILFLWLLFKLVG